MRAKIPLFRQPNNAGNSLCGEACLKMIYRRRLRKEISIYRVSDELFAIKKKMNKYAERGGKTPAELGLHILQNGMGATIQMWPTTNNAFAFHNANYLGATDLYDELNERFSEIERAEAWEELKVEWTTILKFMKMGGTFRMMPCGLEEMKKRLDNGVIVMLDYAYFRSVAEPQPDPVHHFVVPIEISDRRVVVNDPFHNEPFSFPRDLFLLLFHAADSYVIFAGK